MSAVNVYFGSETGARKYLPEDSLKAKHIYIQSCDSTYRLGYGWALWLDPDSTWYHLGGNTKKKPTIYALKYKHKSNKWGWTKSTDQAKAEELYEKYGQQPFE